jgi:DNA-directed RNA polymerase subunit M/transcription elongation factor TFIIS
VSANSKTVYEKHLSTEKHIRKSKDVPIFPQNGKTGKNEMYIIDINETERKINGTYNCNKCGKSYYSNSGLYKHVKKCGNTVSDESIEILKLKHEMELMKQANEIELLKREKEMLLDRVEKNDKIIDIGSKSMNGLIQTNMRALEFLNTYYKDTPHLENFEEKFVDPYTFYLDKKMKYDGTNFIIGKEKIDKDDYIIIKIVNMESMDQIVPYYVSKMIEYYKNAKCPELQKLWASDTSRTSYTIKSKFGENITGWQADKSGNIIIDRVLNPLLMFTRDLIMSKCGDNEEYLEYIAKETKYSTYKTANLLAKYKFDINNNIIQPEIMKQLSSHMYIDVNKQLQLISNDDINLV